MRYIYLLLFILTISCSKDKTVQEIFSPVHEVSCNEIRTNFLIGNPYQIEVIDSLVFLADNIDEKALVIFNKDDDTEAKRIISIGQGPEEITPPIQINISPDKKDIEILQRQNGIYYEYQLSDLRKDSLKNKNKIQFGNIEKLIKTKNGFISDGFYKNGSIGIHDKKGNILEEFNPYPEYLDAVTDLSNKYRVGQGYISYNEETSILIFASYFTGEINIYKLLETNKLSLINNIDLPNNSILRNRVLNSPHNTPILGTDIEYCIDTYSTSKYFYILYSGESMNNRANAQNSYILRFDNKGEILDCFKTNQKLYRICIAGDDHKVYAISQNPNLDYIIVEIDL